MYFNLKNVVAANFSLFSTVQYSKIFFRNIESSVVDPNTLNLDPDPQHNTTTIKYAVKIELVC